MPTAVAPINEHTAKVLNALKPSWSNPVHVGRIIGFLPTITRHHIRKLVEAGYARVEDELVSLTETGVARQRKKPAQPQRHPAVQLCKPKPVAVTVANSTTISCASLRGELDRRITDAGKEPCLYMERKISVLFEKMVIPREFANTGSDLASWIRAGNHLRGQLITRGYEWLMNVLDIWVKYETEMRDNAAKGISTNTRKYTVLFVDDAQAHRTVTVEAASVGRAVAVAKARFHKNGFHLLKVE